MCNDSASIFYCDHLVMAPCSLVYHIKPYYKPEDHNLNLNRHENLKFHIFFPQCLLREESKGEGGKSPHSFTLSEKQTTRR
jgi:hypothetical protein